MIFEKMANEFNSLGYGYPITAESIKAVFDSLKQDEVKAHDYN